MAMNIANGTRRTGVVRDVKFPVNFGNALIYSWPSLGSCLHAIDGQAPLYSEYESSLVKFAGAYSQINRILTDAPFPTVPEAIFGPEPVHDWCYYYQRIDLAQQMGDWEEIIRLLEEAQIQGYEPNDRMEWLPVIRAYTRLGRFDEAEALIIDIRTKRSFNLAVCSQLAQPFYRQVLQEYDFIFTGLCEWE
jgi:hypothetical protein